MFKLENISYTYDATQAPSLADINLTITPGDFVALMGPNGSGKSTLFKILTGLLKPQTGTYYFEEKLVDSTDRCQNHLHQRIGFVFQNSDVQLFNDTVFEELAFGPKQQGLASGAVHQRVTDVLTLLGIEALAQRVPYQLSGGEQKLVALGSVLTMNPAVIILDEPYNGLSMAYQTKLTQLLQSLNAAGKTILVASHNFQQIAELANRVVVFNAQHQLVLDTPLNALTAPQEADLRQL
ncbi:MAG: energy-coupling factor ABC transporter ATP-binding protein [Lactobacillus sp.]|jgi:cobalt/nickel transport system ATP-binding protein|nr:energy-coupling factor ABC transporter ATP-binding protein [Lactobacillus sp.]